MKWFRNIDCEFTAYFSKFQLLILIKQPECFRKDIKISKKFESFNYECQKCKMMKI